MSKQIRATTAALATSLALSLSGCGYNTFQSADEQIKAGWAEVINEYQRRADLIPNLVSTVKGEAKFEQDTLTRVIEARSRATSIQATPELINDPVAFQKFQQAQGELTGALSRLMVVSEQYQSQPGISGPLCAIGGYREPHFSSAQSIHPIGSDLQRHCAVVPLEPHRHGDGIQGKGDLRC